MFIQAQTLPDAWFQALYNLCDYEKETGEFKNAVLYPVQQGSFQGSRRLEFPNIMIEIKYPQAEPLLPFFPEHLNLPPTSDMEYVYGYFTNYLMTREILDNSVYTYGSRINKLVTEKTQQMDLLIERLIDHPHSNQLVLQIAEPDDVLLEDPPCLRQIQFKVINNTLELHITFRSNDLWCGFPANMASLALLQKYISMCCPDLKPGRFVYYSSGLHLYEHNFDTANIRLAKDVPYGDPEEYKEGKTIKEIMDGMSWICDPEDDDYNDYGDKE